MPYEKHEHTRKPLAERTQKPLQVRVAGGGVRLGELEIQELRGNGLTSCLDELQLRGNAVNISWCVKLGGIGRSPAHDASREACSSVGRERDRA